MQEKLLRLSEMNEIYKNTPEVTVYGNAGELVARQLSYYRATAGEAAKLRIEIQQYDSSGQLESSIDPRLSGAYLKQSASIVPNQQQTSTLSGVSQNNNVDAGIRVFINNCRGQPPWSWDSRETERSFEYDKLRRVKQVMKKKKWTIGNALSFRVMAKVIFKEIIL